MQHVTGRDAAAPYPDPCNEVGPGIQSLTSEDLLVYVQYHPVGYARRPARVDLLSIYCTVVVFYESVVIPNTSARSTRVFGCGFSNHPPLDQHKLLRRF